ncbi:MAG: histidine kinase [Thermoanaerobaculia bacterium]
MAVAISSPAHRSTLRVSFSSPRWALAAGFGGLLVLMLFAGLDAGLIFRKTEAENERIRREFLQRLRILEKIRSDLYLSGTYARDYLLEPEAGNAASHRALLEATRTEMDDILERYVGFLPQGEAAAVVDLRREVSDYWRTLAPVFRWSADERRERGYAFFSSEIVPRRLGMLEIADRIARLNEEQLAAGELRVDALFARVKTHLTLALIASLALGLVFSGLAVRRILHLEELARRRYAELEAARKELQELSARLCDVQETERRTISRELHDEVGQALTALLVDLGHLEAAVPGPAEPALKARVAQIRKLAEGTVGVVRNMALLLRPSMLDDLGLGPALEWQAREVSKRSGLKVNVSASDLDDGLPDDYKTCLYRVVQEALHNCVRHAQATQIRITVRQEPTRILLTVEDDGQGFRPDQGRGLGILGIGERFSRLGGTFRIDSEPGAGTVLSGSLPLPAKGLAV